MRVLETILAQRTARQKQEFEQQQAVLAAERQAQLDAAEEARKERAHQADMATKMLDAQLKVRKELAALGESQETARQQVGAVEKAAPVTPQAEPIVRGEALPAGIFPLMPQDEQNAAMQLQAQEQYYGPVAAQQAALANSISQVPELQSLRRRIPDLAAQRFATGARQTEEKAAAARTEWDRQFGKNRGAAIDDREDQQRFTAQQAADAEERAIRRPVEIPKERERELQKLSNMIADPKIQGPERELAENQYRAIRAEANADLTRSQDSSVVTENRRRAEENFEYDQVYDQSRSVTELIRRLETGDTRSIGVEAWASEVLGNFKNIVQTTSSVPFMDRYTSSLDSVLNNPANTTAEKQKIIDTYFSQENLDRVASGNLTEQEMQWWFMYSLNPDGRVSNMLAKDTQNNVQIIGPMVGPKLALSRLRAMSNRQGQFLRRRRSYIRKVDETEAFDPVDGRRVASESLPMPPPGVPSVPAGAVPRMTPEERARAISGAR